MSVSARELCPKPGVPLPIVLLLPTIILVGFLLCWCYWCYRREVPPQGPVMLMTPIMTPTAPLQPSPVIHPSYAPSIPSASHHDTKSESRRSREYLSAHAHRSSDEATDMSFK
ncbi:unnamed protein product [Cylicocyclus nassatus]|uniref:Uncharacterized protein n=1 Tax=Cylicocyclus nassatus TaxID=53992 RepID=A0AA36MDZ8_CYLNA|nr:unnamed protein product [Cylicocyclus nassatus]